MYRFLVAALLLAPSPALSASVYSPTIRSCTDTLSLSMCAGIITGVTKCLIRRADSPSLIRRYENAANVLLLELNPQRHSYVYSELLEGYVQARKNC